MSEPTLVASILCEDILPSTLIDGRITLYRVLFDLTAGRFPARAYRLFAVNLWRGGHGEYSGRVQIVTPSGQIAAQAESAFHARPEGHHAQIVRFNDLVLPEPGEYAVITARNGQIVQTYTVVVADAGQTKIEEN